MNDNIFASAVDFAAGGLLLAAVLVVWRRELPSIVRLLTWQGWPWPRSRSSAGSGTWTSN